MVRRALVLLAILSGLGTACGRAPENTFRRELAVVMSACPSVPAATPSERERECQRLYHFVHEKHGYGVDEFTQAEMAYRLALVERVERKEMAPPEAEVLLAELKRRLAAEREDLVNLRRHAALQVLYWSNFWRSWRNPVECTTSHNGYTAVTKCQ